MKLSLILLSCLFIITSCVEDDEAVTLPFDEGLVVNAFFPLEIGNYWVFEFQTQLPDGSTTGNISIDSLIVVGDTLIDETLYYLLTTQKPLSNTTWFLTDSSGYIMSKGGSVILPPVISETMYNEHYGMNLSDTTYYYFDQFPRNEAVSTNFGVIDVFTHEATHIVYPPIGDYNALVDTSYYADFGPVQRSYAFGSGAKLVGKLTTYHLEE